MLNAIIQRNNREEYASADIKQVGALNDTRPVNEGQALPSSKPVTYANESSHCSGT